DGRLLAAACRDTTVLVWDTTLAGTQQPEALDGATLERLWKDLEEADPAGGSEVGMEKLGISWKDLERGKSGPAYEAMGKMVADPDRSLPFLRRHLEVLRPPDAERLRRLIADLDADAFSRRDTASRELAGLGERAGPALRAALAAEPPPE